MEYEVEREPGQWHIREKGQLTRGTTVTDSWLQSMGFGRPSRQNIDAIVRATYASAAGMTLDKYALPKDTGFKPGFASYPSLPERG